MKLDDPRWKTMHGGYRIPYDPTNALRNICDGEDLERAWNELWENLHHQGDVGEVSYACVPYLASIQEQQELFGSSVFAIACTIELARHRDGNPEMPTWLADSYNRAWQSLMSLALRGIPCREDVATIRTMLGAIAIAKGDVRGGELMAEFTDDELAEILAKYRGRT